MQYRLATVADAAQLAAMNQQLIRDEGHRNPMNLSQLEQRMAGFLAGEYQAILFEQDDAQIGYALFKHEPDHVYLRQFWISPQHRRKGLGRTALQWLRTNPWKNHARIRLDVLTKNPTGIAFWRSVGFADYCLTMEMENKMEG